MMKLRMAMRLVVLLLASVMATAPLAHSLPDQSPEAVEGWFKRLPHARERLTKLHFYFQEKVTGDNPNAVEVARADVTSTSPTFFGLVRVFDVPLTVGPSPLSKKIGYSQGIYALTSQEELSLLFTFNFVFTDGKYNGSTVSVNGRNPLAPEYREMPIVGGSGVFRLARGSAVASTYWANLTAQEGIVEFTLLLHQYQELEYVDGDDK